MDFKSDIQIAQETELKEKPTTTVGLGDALNNLFTFDVDRTGKYMDYIRRINYAG